MTLALGAAQCNKAAAVKILHMWHPGRRPSRVMTVHQCVMLEEFGKFSQKAP